MLRALATLLAGFVLGVGAAACGDEEEPTTTTAAPQTTTTTEAEPEAEPEGDAGDDKQEAGSAERPERPLGIEAVLAAVMTDSGSAAQACDELVTETFLRDAFGGRANCIAARKQGGVGRELEIEDIAEEAETATAEVVPKGGPYGGVTVEVDLVADPELEGAWLVDGLFADVPAGP